MKDKRASLYQTCPVCGHFLYLFITEMFFVNEDIHKKYGELKDVAPTFLDLMQLKPNKSFTGKSLII